MNVTRSKNRLYKIKLGVVTSAHERQLETTTHAKMVPELLEATPVGSPSTITPSTEIKALVIEEGITITADT